METKLGKKGCKVQAKTKPEFNTPKESLDKGKAMANQECTKDIKCFKCFGWGHIASQCPNKRTILMSDVTYKSRDEDDDLDDMPKLEDSSDDEGGNILTQMEGKSLIIKQALNMQLQVEYKNE